MCGITGFNWEDHKLMKSILKEISHRGPDASGRFFDKGISLGHNRLSILDLSSLGKQPMSNEDGTIWIVFNGEIYNYKEIKDNLKQQHTFSSSTDTEVLIHLYEEQGFNLVNFLQGMFAFCIYDSKRKLLFLARDRVGIKPLYYFNFKNKFIFCSEIKGILQDRSIEREVNKKALSPFLTFRANTSEETFFKGIKKLMPATILIYYLESNKFITKSYWDIKVFENNYDKKSFFELLNDSVKSRLMSDVPYGAYLSGGIDSGIIVSLMSRFSQQPVKTFSVGFEEEKEKETTAAKSLSQFIGTDHHELLINKSSIKYLPKIIYQLDEPMSDPTSIPIYLLSQYAKKYCTVILTGEGSDELFAGYPQYKFMKLHNMFLKNSPVFVRKSILSIATKTPGPILNKGFKFASALGEKGIERFSNFITSEKPSEQYLDQVAIFNEEEQGELLTKKVELYKNYEKYFNEKLITSCQLLDFREPMIEDLLMKLDKNTMAFSIEGRVPFLDYRIVEFAFGIPENKKLHFLTDKYLLRKMALKEKLVPRETAKRKKRHFFVPIDNWFKEELSSLRKELLSKSYLEKQKIFNPRYIEKINSGFDKSKLFYSRQLWSLLTFQIWHKQYIEGINGKDIIN